MSAGRAILVGDVHGCRDELDTLLDQVGFTVGDRLISVGDLVARGPDTLGVLDIVRRTGALVVRGNHEARLLDWYAAPESTHLGPQHANLARELRPADWTILNATPLWMDLPEHDVRVVHAGLVPGVPMDQQEPRMLFLIRGVTPEGQPDASGQHPLWGLTYVGPPHVVFGHHAMRGLQLHPWATGLDTGCVYGGQLTALVLAAGEVVPLDPRERGARLVTVPARQAYHVPQKR